MQSVAFNAHIEHGMITIPKEYQKLFEHGEQNSKVILLQDDENDELLYHTKQIKQSLQDIKEGRTTLRHVIS